MQEEGTNERAVAEDKDREGGGMSMFLRLMLMWTVGNMLIRGRRNQQQQHQQSDGNDADVSGGGLAPASRRNHRPIFPDGAKLSLRIVVSEREEVPVAGGWPKRLAADGGGYGNGGDDLGVVLHEWCEEGLFYDWRDGNTRNTSFNVSVTPGMLANRSVYAHVTATLEGYSHDPGTPHYDATKTLYRRAALTEHRLPLAVKKVRSLLGDAAAADEGRMETETLDRGHPDGADGEADGGYEAEAAAAGGLKEGEPPTPKSILFWKPALSVSLVHDVSVYSPGGIPPQVLSELRFDSRGDYYPALYTDTFWLMQKDHVAVNGSLATLPLALEYSTLGVWKWMMQLQMAAQWKQQSAMGLQTDASHDELKRMLLETDPVLLGVTMVVSVLHTIFDFLAFKNDVQFWRKKKSLEGLSVRSIGLNVFFQVKHL